MATDSDMKIDNAAYLRQLQAELDGMDERRQALLATIAAVKRLVDGDEGRDVAYPPAEDAPVRMPVIPPGFFATMTTTHAYRELMKRWPGHYRPPQIADLFLQGGLSATSRTALVQAIHSVLKRERDKKKAAEQGRIGGILPMPTARMR